MLCVSPLCVSPVTDPHLLLPELFPAAEIYSTLNTFAFFSFEHRRITIPCFLIISVPHLDDSANQDVISLVFDVVLPQYFIHRRYEEMVLSAQLNHESTECVHCGIPQRCTLIQRAHNGMDHQGCVVCDVQVVCPFVYCFQSKSKMSNGESVK